MSGHRWLEDAQARRPRHMLCSKRDGVFGHDCFPRRRVRCDENGVPHLEVIHRFLLECIKFEGILRTGCQDTVEFFG